MAQFIRPSSNITQTNFTNGFAEIDESSASDTDFAYSANNTTAVLQVLLSAPATPLQAGTTTVRYRIARTNGATVDGTGSNSTVVAEVRQGATTIATDTTQNTTGTWTTVTWTPDLTSITDWSDVRLYFSVIGGGGSPANRRGAGISWAEIETPDQLTFTTEPRDGTGSSTSIATGDAVYYFIGEGASSSASLKTGELNGFFNSDGSITSSSIVVGEGWDGIVRSPGDLINDVETNGWGTNSTSLNDAIDEEEVEDDADLIWSPSFVGADQSTLFSMTTIASGTEYRCSIRAKTSSSVQANIRLMFYMNGVFVEQTPQQLLSQTFSTYEFIINPASDINQVRIHVSEVV